jgi:FkbM family methyltransferase
VDVGANVGVVSIPIAKVRPLASLLCLEADSRIHNILQENVRRNGCTGITSICCLVGAADGHDVDFFRAPDEKFGMGSVGPQFGVEPVRVAQRSLDSLISELGMPAIDMLKLDIEGAELGALQGAQRLLNSEKPPVIVFEFVDWAEARLPHQIPGDAQEFLLSHGYELHRLGPGGKTGERISKPLREGAAMLVAVPRRGTPVLTSVAASFKPAPAPSDIE